mgnify:CR=1 FL=1
MLENFKNKKILIPTIIILGIIIYIIISKLTADNDPYVEAETVKRRTIIHKVNASGKIQPEEEVQITSTITGWITEITVNEGDTVKSGQHLISIDEKQYRPVYNQALSQVKSASANLRKIESQLERTKALFSQKLISKQDLEQIETSYEIALSQSEQANANLLRAEDELSKTRLTAPKYGIVTSLTKEKGEMVNLTCFRNGKDEATGISDEIEKTIKKKYSLNNVAILVRAIFQTREFEERFLKIGMPYRILGGIKFYERAEIKDCISYLRIIFQEKDDLAFERIVNNPKRSIGESTLKQINEFARKNNFNLEQSSKKMIELNLIKPKAKIGLSSFLKLIDKWRVDNHKIKNHVKLMQLILDESGYSAMLKNKKDLENENRLENIKELLSAMKEFDNLESFLEHVSLATSVDQEWDGEKINMMTMHAAKGLEFDVVFLPGWEEGLFPHQKSIDEKGEQGLEEERRLAYVGITRAKNLAYISFSMSRFYQGDWIESIASRFVDELPESNISKKNNFEENNYDEDFDFNQDFSYDNEESNIKSPGWIRYQKKLK